MNGQPMPNSDGGIKIAQQQNIKAFLSGTDTQRIVQTVVEIQPDVAINRRHQHVAAGDRFNEKHVTQLKDYCNTLKSGSYM